MSNDQTSIGYPEIPSDLPEYAPTHPGKTLTHRYGPTSFPKGMIEPAFTGPRNLASEVNYKPVTTMNIANESVYVKPISNIKPRNIAPLTSEGFLVLPIRGERVMDLSPEIQEQVKQRIDRTLEEAFNEREEAASEITEEAAESPTPPIAAHIAAETPTVQEVMPPTTQEIVSVPEIPSPPPPPPSPFAEPQLKETGDEAAKELSGELESIKNQLDQESLQKTVIQARIAELTNKYQAQLAKITLEKNQLTDQVLGLRDKLMTETKRRLAGESSIETTTTQLKTEINKMKIERDGLLGQLNESQNRFMALREQQAKSANANVEITQLKAKLAQVESEKEDVEQKSIKLEALVTELREKSVQTGEMKQVIIPKEAPEKARGVPVRIVHPSPAIGRMAPQLTTIPNVVNGIIKDERGMLLSDVVIVVKDSVGNPVRALKSNKIGQFAISTPLPDGTYTMEMENPENEFDVVQISLEGKVMPPIEIRAR